MTNPHCHAERSEASIYVMLEEGIMKAYYVYILGNGRGTLYVGMTSDLERRMYEHKTKVVKGFTSKYNLHHYYFLKNSPMYIRHWTKRNGSRVG